MKHYVTIAILVVVFGGCYRYPPPFVVIENNRAEPIRVYHKNRNKLVKAHESVRFNNIEFFNERNSVIVVAQDEKVVMTLVQNENQWAFDSWTIRVPPDPTEEEVSPKTRLMRILNNTRGNISVVDLNRNRPSGQDDVESVPPLGHGFLLVPYVSSESDSLSFRIQTRVSDRIVTRTNKQWSELNWFLTVKS